MPEHMHGAGGRFGGGWGWGGRPMMGRRIGYPLFGGGYGMGGFGLGGLGMGGLGSGLGGGGLLSDLLSGGIGYLAGKNMAQNQQQAGAYPPQYQPYPSPTPQYQPPPQPLASPYQVPPAPLPVDNTQSSRLAQLKLLGQLREQGTLTEDEFQAEKQRILNG